MFGALRSIDGPAADALLEVAADFTPRFELHAPDEVVLDLAGLERLFGGPHAIGEELCRAGAERQLRLRIAIAGTCSAARLLARAESPEPEDVAVVESGAEAIALAQLSIDLLTVIENAEPAPSHLAPSHRRTLLYRPSVVGGSAHWVSWRRCPLTAWLRDWACVGHAGSASHVARIRGRCGRGAEGAVRAGARSRMADRRARAAVVRARAAARAADDASRAPWSGRSRAARPSASGDSGNTRAVASAARTDA